MAEDTKTTEKPKTVRALPKGFKLVPMPTEAGKVKYSVDVPQGESLEAWLNAIRELNPESNAEEVVVAILNAGNAQGARQSPKAAVRKAAEEHGEESAEVAEAIAKAQEAGRQFIQGAPRAGGGGGKRHESGLTEKERTGLGSAIGLEIAKTGKAPSQARMAEILRELGIDPAKVAT